MSQEFWSLLMRLAAPRNWCLIIQRLINHWFPLIRPFFIILISAGRYLRAVGPRLTPAIGGLFGLQHHPFGAHSGVPTEHHHDDGALVAPMTSQWLRGGWWMVVMLSQRKTERRRIASKRIWCLYCFWWSCCSFFSWSDFATFTCPFFEIHPFSETSWWSFHRWRCKIVHFWCMVRLVETGMSPRQVLFPWTMTGHFWIMGGYYDGPLNLRLKEIHFPNHHFWYPPRT